MCGDIKSGASDAATRIRGESYEEEDGTEVTVRTQ